MSLADPVAALIRLIVQGGPVVAVLLVMSVASVSIVIAKWAAFRRAGVWRHQGFALSDVAAAARRVHAMPELSPEERREETERVASAHVVELESGLRVLEAVSALAPLLGLLGTVLGMIEAFQALETSGAAADPTILAGGIWQALLTTAVGLVVAVPAALALHVFDGALRRLRHDMADAAVRILVPVESAASTRAPRATTRPAHAAD